jgi:AcrR family transcriptional regulator
VAASQRTRLLGAVGRAVAEKGYAAATVADAVRLARVSRGTFYALFASKEACLAAAYRLGTEVLEEHVRAAVAEAADWREELRLGIRAYLRTLAGEPRFARVFLLDLEGLGEEREAAVARFARRYGASLARSGRPRPPDAALLVLSAGVHHSVRAAVRAGDDPLALEDTLVGCAVRLVAKEETWT